MAASDVKSSALWLGKLLAEEINYLVCVREKVEKLQRELNALASFLTDTIKSHSQDNVVRTTISEARDIAYDCEDVIETYILEVARKGYEEYSGLHLGTIKRWANLLIANPFLVHKLCSQTDQLYDRIIALKESLKSYGVSDRIINAYAAETNNSTESLRRVYTHQKEESVVVGLESQVDELVKMLRNPMDQRVIAICGMGGVGKSTLARELYHHPELRGGGGFEAFGWASASHQFLQERVLRNLLYSLVPEDDNERRKKMKNKLKGDRPERALYDLMREVKCLVVIDDIWSSKDWARLQAAFPRLQNEAGSRIVLTTRNEETMASFDQTQMHLHAIKGLDDERSWELFERTAFATAACKDSRKEELGREMLQHCRGVPLAIVVLAKVLKRKENVEDWKQIHNEICTEIMSGGAPSFYKDVHDVLQLSYDELPIHLKHCFLHLGNFPKDYEIDTAKLYHLWVAEGIVLNKGRPNESEEDVAERYLNELVSRNMVQVASWIRMQGTRRIKTCRIHDLMRDVCIEIANREGFLQIINFQRPLLLSNDKNEEHILMASLPERDTRLHRRRRRLSVYVSDQEPQSSTLPITTTTTISKSAKVSKAPNLRTLLIHPISEQLVDKDDTRLMETIFDDFPLLRVFDCENFQIRGKLHEKVGNLVHLRHLGLANTRVTELPSSIEKLQWLQTLDLRVNVVIFLPNVLWKMTQLRHVYLPDDGGFKLAKKERILSSARRYLLENGTEELRLDGLENLQTLKSIDLDRVDLRGLSELKRLKTLKAACETKVEALRPFLKYSGLKNFELRLHAQILKKNPEILSTCEALHLHLHIHAKAHANFHIGKPLSLKMLPKSLVSLGIWYLRLDKDPFPVLEKLPNLVDLRLIMCYGGQKMVCSANGFPQLTTLCLYRLRNFSRWEVEQGALRKLETLLIINCQVTQIPDALPSSVNVTIHGTG